jgi:choline dehydrogenase
LVRPYSTGTVRLASSDPCAAPIIDVNYLSDPRDWDICRAALRFTLRLGREMRKSGYDIEEVPGQVPDSMTEADLDAFVRKAARSIWHLSSTARMAPEHDARPGVVDDELRVHGVAGLRVADASMFPSVPATHAQAAVVMVAEKCAEMILAGVDS